ncbi:MAG: DUF2851 family protein [Bacteroidia bacterium]
MTEDLLHFIWKFKLLKPKNLFSIGEMPVSILNTGEHNMHAGPDFTNARIKLGDTIWAGNIEIHKRSSDWFVHNHHTDKAYDNVILHVVYEYNGDVFNSKNQPVPCLELKDLIGEDVLLRYEHIYKSKQSLPCGNQFADVFPIEREAWLDRMLIERIEYKTKFIEEIHGLTNRNWDETLYLLLCKNLGFKINADAFLQLGKATPLYILLKHANSIEQTEALLLGQAGLLETRHDDAYIRRLKGEYSHLKRKYGLNGPIPHTWKFLRMRPRNFPTIRIAQLAGFISRYQHTFSKLIEARSLKEAMFLFETKASPYWENHFVLGETSIKEEKKLGISSIENIFINTICPLLFYYGKAKQEGSVCEKALIWMYGLKAESNNVTRLYRENGYKANSAANSQALLQLHSGYCSHKKCLSCGIGTQILRGKKLQFDVKANV